MELHLLRQRLVGDDERAADHVGVAAAVLGGGVHDHVRAQVQRLLQIRGGERVVDDHQGAEGVGDLGDGGDVGHRHQRVGRGLHPDRDRLPRQDGRLHGGQVGEIDRIGAQPPRLVRPREQPERAAVRVVRQHQVRPGLGDRADHRVLGGQTAGEGEATAAALECGQALLQRGPRRVGGAGVLVPVPQPADAVLGERGGRHDRRDHRTGGGVRGRSGVDGAGREAWSIAHAASVRGSDRTVRAAARPRAGARRVVARLTSPAPTTRTPPPAAPAAAPADDRSAG